MEHWIEENLHLSLNEATFVATVVAAVIAALAFVGSVRRGAGRVWRWLLLWTGFTRRRYARWFLAEHGVLKNIYLDDTEQLDLGATYVSLSFYSHEEERESRVVATAELARREMRHAIITGDPGTGKSTLLRAYGAGILRTRRRLIGSDLLAIARSHEVPIFVPLRRFAQRAEAEPGSLTEFITDEILRRQARVRAPERFLRHLLRRDACLLLLDGLDEVVDARYEAVRRAIFEFVEGGAGVPDTRRARVVVTCRSQNFLAVRPDWIPSFAEREYGVAPLRDAEIWRFLEKRRGDFTRPRSASAFHRSILASSALDLHRIPLILTISLALYLHRTAYEIPSRIATFYDAMLDLQLRRHDFREDPLSAKANRYEAEDKLRFLRWFARQMAARPAPFDEFTFGDLIGHARSFTQRLSRVQPAEAEAFVREIIEHSGLLASVSDEDAYVFAHRSIHEFLIAAQFQRERRGEALLWDRSADHEWRQVIVFFVSLDHDDAEPFLHGLAERNLELAVHCLAAAGPVPDGFADELLAGLAQQIRSGTGVAVHLAALVAAVRSQKHTVRDRAVGVVRDTLEQLLARDDLRVVLGGDPETILRLLDTLAETGSATIARTVPRLARLVADDESRIVGPLWKCLAVPGLDAEAAKAIVLKLLGLAADPDGFRELEAQPAYRADVLTEDLRRRAYPFDRGLDREANLVTLLAWAEHLDLEAPPVNRFLEARAAGRDVLARVERDRRRGTIAVDMHLVGKVLVWGGLLGTVVALAVEVTRGIAIFELSGIGWWSIAVYMAAAGLAGACQYVVERVWSQSFSETRRRFTAHPVDRLDDSGVDMVLGLSWLVGTVLYPAALGPLLGSLPLPAFVAATAAVVWLSSFLPFAPLFDRGSRLYLRKPSPYVDMYDDPRSRHWLVRPKPPAA